MRKFNIASLILAGLLAFAPAAFARGGGGGGHGGGGHFGGGGHLGAGHAVAGHYGGFHGGYWRGGHWYAGGPWWGDGAGIYDYDYDDDYYPDTQTLPTYTNVVVVVQQELAKLGYYHGPIDGIVGPETEKAISWFQSVDKITVTGAINGQTLKALQIS